MGRKHSRGGTKMKIKIEYFKWFNNKPLLTEFEGTENELKNLLKIGITLGV